MATKLNEPKELKVGVKAVRLPSKEIMLAQLRERTGPFVLGISRQTDAFYEHFVGSIANSKTTAEGLETAWESATYDKLAESPKAFIINIALTFERAVRTIAPEIAEDAIKLRAGKMNAEVSKLIRG